MTHEDFLHLISGGETARLECKLAKNAIPSNFNIFSLVKIGERSGMGLSQLYGNWEVAGYAKPLLTESFNPDRTKVEIEIEVAENGAKVAEKVAENGAKVAENDLEVAESRQKVDRHNVGYTENVAETASDVTGKVSENLSETEEKIVRMILGNGHISQREISECIGLTRQYVGRCMDTLQSRKIIRRVGPDKGGHWEVIRT